METWLVGLARWVLSNGEDCDGQRWMIVAGGWLKLVEEGGFVCFVLCALAFFLFVFCLVDDDVLRFG